METTNNTQTGAIAPAVLTLDPGAFTSALLPLVGVHKIGWSGEDHLKLVEALLAELKDETGAGVELTEDQMDRLRLIFRPTEETQRKVLKHTLAEAGVELGGAAEKTFVLLMAPAQFSDYLGKTKRPGSDATFIVKEKKRGVKQEQFSSLFAAAATAPAP